ncbi:hypothetical protein BBO99_00008021 [Phytophthora kernoviae]|uniref:Rho-GAP domain-containing protein n=2 Tax=Phytophthora kernoviae TaxID=325452 RepID=A0A3R7KBT1_9STRA|nr:hypothetical protein G195_007037 [Phytophthora kernoviae 00238/432]KAG2515379.1 hypothetical protein JM16_007734 [Phytophthora kernoviae]KAG2518570.1 hypothetical protein JM18_007656 [Phytophthora kernoviae]RLN45335.1 hypothetical protein BBI17_007889 [Phytophthora kernoviae]RLN75842.1 hypothetical protein BBO99_00008021 [Phytophthora kernoviae]
MSSCLNIQLPEHPTTVKDDSGGSSPSSPSNAPQPDGEHDIAAYMEIGSPYGFKHDVHIHYNFEEARFEGIPDNFAQYLLCTDWADTCSSIDPVGILNQHFKLSFRQVPRVAVPGYEERVPAVLVMLQQHFLAKKGFLMPHIFRESPSKDERDQAMKDIDRGAFRGAEHDVRVLADLIKVWFRELPMPILHEIPASELERLALAEDVEFQVLNLLGGLERCIILWLADLLVYVAEFQPQNHMGVDQLAIVIAPNLVRLETENPMVAVALSKAAVDLFRGVLRARFQRRQELQAAAAAEGDSAPIAPCV